MCLEIIYLVYMDKKCLELNNLQWYTIKLIQTKLNVNWICHLITNKGWYAVKHSQPPCLNHMSSP